MMVTPEYCRMMARYNAWQNEGLRRLLTGMPDVELLRERGAFFGSIMATVNHLLWADRIWMARLAGTERPAGGIADSVGLTPTAAVWGAERFRTDGAITLWAERVDALDLLGDLVWQSALTGREERRAVAMCVVHMFNHQTHHRGQVHAMLTAAGMNPGPTELFLMPEQAGET
jgi:uncharacterized damage-inducible protein DinB